MPDMEKKARVLMTPVQEYTPEVIAYLFRKITGQNLPEFQHDVRINRNGQYDDLFMKEGEIPHADKRIPKTDGNFPVREPVFRD